MYCTYMYVSTHLPGDRWLNGNRNDSCKDAAVEGIGKLGGLIGPEDQRHSVPRLDQLPPAQLVEHVVGDLLGPSRQLACKGERYAGYEPGLKPTHVVRWA